MRNVPVAYMRPVSRDDGAAVLAIQLAQPVEALAASVFAHDSVDAAWRAGIQRRSTDNPLVGALLGTSIPSGLPVGGRQHYQRVLWSG
jgi:hypothetical protein